MSSAIDIAINRMSDPHDSYPGTGLTIEVLNEVMVLRSELDAGCPVCERGDPSDKDYINELSGIAMTQESEISILKAELEPWRELERMMKSIVSFYDVHNIDHYEQRTNGVNWVFSLRHPVFETTEDFAGATLPEAVKAACDQLGVM